MYTAQGWHLSCCNFLAHRSPQTEKTLST